VAVRRIEAWQSFAEDLTFICECAMSLIDPEVIVIGGSLARAADIFEPELRKRLEGRSTQIAFAELGTAAGVIGAAALGF
jgi:glucokinase